MTNRFSSIPLADLEILGMSLQEFLGSSGRLASDIEEGCYLLPKRAYEMDTVAKGRELYHELANALQQRGSDLDMGLSFADTLLLQQISDEQNSSR